jgi:hypothetical protein
MLSGRLAAAGRAGRADEVPDRGDVGVEDFRRTRCRLRRRERGLPLCGPRGPAAVGGPPSRLTGARCAGWGWSAAGSAAGVAFRGAARVRPASSTWSRDSIAAIRLVSLVAQRLKPSRR